MKILITGFEPFGGHTTNPSKFLLQSLPDQYLNITITKKVLPVDHQQVPGLIKTYLEAHKPDAVLAFGLAAQRKQISIERVAINLMDFSIADNAGFTIQDLPVIEGGPVAYFSTLPTHAMVSTLNKADIPAETSLSAGAFLCNQVFYLLMHHITIHTMSTRAGFIHLPPLDQIAHKNSPSTDFNTPLDSIGLDIIIKAAYLLFDQLIIAS